MGAIDDNTAPKMVLNDTVVKSEEPTGKTVEWKITISQQFTTVLR